MGMNQTLFVMTGIKFKYDELPFNLDDEKYLPYIEGYPETDIRITHGESEYVYVGEVIESKASDEYDDIDKVFVIPSHYRIATLISEILGMNIAPSDIDDWIFTIWR